ncbi:MAG: hypothetical protein HQM08_03125 [Candidatus Riflebacteria bacterium]|nr:hypothetical protein [Candidatus Riflebacteria bacterium]
MLIPPDPFIMPISNQINNDPLISISKRAIEYNLDQFSLLKKLSLGRHSLPLRQLRLTILKEKKFLGKPFKWFCRKIVCERKNLWDLKIRLSLSKTIGKLNFHNNSERKILFSCELSPLEKVAIGLSRNLGINRIFSSKQSFALRRSLIFPQNIVEYYFFENCPNEKEQGYEISFVKKLFPLEDFYPEIYYEKEDFILSREEDSLKIFQGQEKISTKFEEMSPNRLWKHYSATNLRFPKRWLMNYPSLFSLIRPFYRHSEKKLKIEFARLAFVGKLSGKIFGMHKKRISLFFDENWPGLSKLLETAFFQAYKDRCVSFAKAFKHLEFLSNLENEISEKLSLFSPSSFSTDFKEELILEENHFESCDSKSGRFLGVQIPFDRNLQMTRAIVPLKKIVSFSKRSLDGKAIPSKSKVSPEQGINRYLVKNYPISSKNEENRFSLSITEKESTEFSLGIFIKEEVLPDCTNFGKSLWQSHSASPTFFKSELGERKISEFCKSSSYADSFEWKIMIDSTVSLRKTDFQIESTKTFLEPGKKMELGCLIKGYLFSRESEENLEYLSDNLLKYFKVFCPKIEKFSCPTNSKSFLCEAKSGKLIVEELVEKCFEFFWKQQFYLPKMAFCLESFKFLSSPGSLIRDVGERIWAEKCDAHDLKKIRFKLEKEQPEKLRSVEFFSYENRNFPTDYFTGVLKCEIPDQLPQEHVLLEQSAKFEPEKCLNYYYYFVPEKIDKIVLKIFDFRPCIISKIEIFKFSSELIHKKLIPIDKKMISVSGKFCVKGEDELKFKDSTESQAGYFKFFSEFEEMPSWFFQERNLGDFCSIDKQIFGKTFELKESFSQLIWKEEMWEILPSKITTQKFDLKKSEIEKNAFPVFGVPDWFEMGSFKQECFFISS